MVPLIETKNLKFTREIVYPDITVYQGGMVFITGPSGSGKTSLLRLFNGSLAPFSGNILYDGDNLEDWETLSLRKEILLVGQEVYLFPGTIEENFKKYYDYIGEPLPSGEEMERILDLVGNEKKWSCETQNLSGGEKRRIYLALFLTRKPRVLLLDEPTAEMDSFLAERFFFNIKQYAREKNITVMVVCHQEEWIEKYGDERIELKK